MIIQLWETYLEAVSPLQHIGHVSVIIFGITGRAREIVGFAGSGPIFES